MSYIMTVCDVHMFVHVFNNNIILFTIIYLLTKRFISRLLSSSVVGNTVCGCGRYKVNGVTGGDEVGDETGDDVWWCMNNTMMCVMYKYWLGLRNIKLPLSNVLENKAKYVHNCRNVWFNNISWLVNSTEFRPELRKSYSYCNVTLRHYQWEDGKIVLMGVRLACGTCP